jgi:hypothetical protein
LGLGCVYNLVNYYLNFWWLVVVELNKIETKGLEVGSSSLLSCMDAQHIGDNVRKNGEMLCIVVKPSAIFVKNIAAVTVIITKVKLLLMIIGEILTPFPGQGPVQFQKRRSSNRKMPGLRLNTGSSRKNLLLLFPLCEKPPFIGGFYL